ncbi:hypothetical protein H5410_046536, partial [Solanum commersonii]
MILRLSLLQLQANISKELFEVTIQDDIGSTTAMISDKIGEELLSLTVVEIHDIRCIKKQLLPLIPVQHKLLWKTFTIQIKKFFAKNKDSSLAKLFIVMVGNTLLSTQLLQLLIAYTFAFDSMDFAAYFLEMD